MPLDQYERPTPPPQRKSWFRRNWLWFLPVGCLGVFVIVVGAIALVLHLIFSTLKSSEPYDFALEQASAHPEVIVALGEPIEASYFVTGSVSLQNADGEANLGIPISGPSGKAIIYVEAEKKAGQWSYQTLVVEIDDPKQRIKLLGE